MTATAPTPATSAGATPATAVGTAPGRRPALLRNGDYVRLMTGQTLSAIGSAMSSFAFLLLGYDLTGSTAVAGGISAAAMAGGVACMLPAGALVDRWSRKRVMLVCCLVGTVLYGSVVAVDATGHLTPAHLVVVAALSAAVMAFFRPAETASLRQIVRPEELPTAMSVNEGRQGVAGLVGAPVAGALFALGRTIPIAADAASYLVSLVCIGTMKAPLPAPATTGRPERVLASIRAGLRWVWRRPDLRGVALLSTIVNFAANGFLTALILVLQQQGTTPAVIGLLDTALAGGMIVGAVLAPALLRRFRTGRLLVVAFWVVAVVLAAMSFSTAFLPLCAGLAATAVLLPAINSGLLSYETLVTPDAMQGRVNTATMFLAMGLAPLAPVASGLALEHWRSTPTLLAFAALLVVAAGLATLSAPLRRIPLLSDVRPAGVSGA